MNHTSPILVGPLLHEICRELHTLLHSLTYDEWHRPTVSSQRQVRDIVSHLLDGSLRRLSMQRDGYSPPIRLTGGNQSEPLLDYLNNLNAEWEQATRRLSPTVLLELLALADHQFAEHMNSLDPFATAIFPVTWAGEESSLNWFDVARDYTERWHHAQQIFEAVNHHSTIVTRRLYHPCLETFMRALPYTYRNVEAADEASVTVEIVGDAGGIWQIARREGQWLFVAPTASSTASVSLRQSDAWKVFTKRQSEEAVLAQFPDIHIEGDHQLGRHVLEMVSVMA